MPVAEVKAPTPLPEVPKHSRKKLGVLLTVFLVMSAAVGTVYLKWPDLITSMLVKNPLRAAAAESNVFINGAWTKTANPESLLKKPEKMAVEQAPAELGVTPEAMPEPEGEAVVSGESVNVIPDTVLTELDQPVSSGEIQPEGAESPANEAVK